jgi:enoyl-CoA hydratase/carnithine racemase
VADAVTTVAPAKRNAFDDTTIAGIDSFFGDPPEQTRAVMHSEGKHFSAGAVPVRIDWR